MEPSAIMSVTDTVAASEATLKSVKVGSAESSYVGCLVSKGALNFGENADGLLGMSFLFRYKFTIDPTKTACACAKVALLITHGGDRHARVLLKRLESKMNENGGSEVANRCILAIREHV